MALKHVLGNVPMINVLGFLLDHPGTDYTTKELADHTDVTQGAMKRDFPGLVDCGMVVETRKIGVFQLYTLNKVDPVVMALSELNRALSDYGSEETVDNSGEKTTAGDEEEYLGPDMEELLSMPDDPEKYPESEEVWET